MSKKLKVHNSKVQILSLALSNEELDELRVVLEFAGMVSLDLASSPTIQDSQLKALKRIAANSASLLTAVSESMKDAIASGSIAETTLH